MRRAWLLFFTAGLVIVWCSDLKAQNPVAGAARSEMLRNLRPTGQPAVPIFEGWYPNADGSHGLCFGYHNLNLERALDIPLGPDNRIEPARFDGVQPTHFDPVPANGDLRYWCVFTVTVPADFGDRDVVWTLRVDGQEYSVPGHTTHPEYRIQEPDHRALRTVAPLVSFVEPAGPAGRGRTGVWSGPVTARVDRALPLRIRVGEPDTDSPHPDPFERVTAHWAEHQGPGQVVFDPSSIVGSPEATGEATVELTTTATFGETGDYLLRVQVFHGRRARWQSQCCWTNAYLRVSVTP